MILTDTREMEIQIRIKITHSSKDFELKHCAGGSTSQMVRLLHHLQGCWQMRNAGDCWNVSGLNTVDSERVMSS